MLASCNIYVLADGDATHFRKARSLTLKILIRNGIAIEIPELC